MKSKTQIRRPEDHDWTGCACTFTGQVGEAGPILGADGRIQKGDTKLSGEVLGQTYLGRSTVYGNIPDFEITVQGRSGAVVKIGLLENNFQVID